MNRNHSTCIAAFLLAASASLAGPVTTVPWNGSTGAVTLTYDDGRPSQLSNLIPQLDQSGLKVTFFLASGIYNFKSSDWAPVEKKGHELANHTSNHSTPTTSNVSAMATTLRAIDPTVQAVTFAYPNCTVTGTDAVSAESFIARGCGSAQYGWNATEPNWMNIQALILGTSNGSSNVSTGTGNINSAKSGNSWTVTLVHDVTSGPDQYSLTPADNKTLLDAASSSKVWVGTFETIGAYYRAHYTMDKVSASAGNGPWNLTWTSPHPKMPKSVMLKVKLDANTFGSPITVSQDNVAIPANSDGSYTIDFMKLKMNVTKGTAGIDNPTIYGTARVSVDGSSIEFSGLTTGNYTLSLRNASGKLLVRTSLAASGPEERIALPAEARGRILAVLQAPGRETRIFPVLVP